MEKEKNILDILLDNNNTDPIEIYNTQGQKYVFEQIAVVPHDGCVFCVLHPITKIENVADDEAMVFKVIEEAGKDPVLQFVADEAVAMKIYEVYLRLVEEAQKKSKKNK